MRNDLLIAGGGIAGLAAAVGARHAGWEARLFEQASAFAEVGAGVQLGPNATRILQRWQLLDHPLLRPFRPARLRVRDAVDGRDLGVLRLGDTALQRYGAPYCTVHRADLHAVLLDAAQSLGAHLVAGRRLRSAEVDGAVVQARADGLEHPVEADALAVADGVWSSLRTQVVGGEGAPPTGHVAYRGLVPRASLPAQGDEVQAWLGPRMHLVSYPVRGGELVNVAGFIEGRAARDWDQEAEAGALHAAVATLCPALRAVVEAVPQWRLWPVHDRDPVGSPSELAHGRALLLGDAAHPMLPYLAQGAGMAIEDAAELQRVLGMAGDVALDVPTALQRYALNRWQRCARVQARARRNARIFHADGALRLARNLAMQVGGERLLDVPWLYRGA